MSAFTWMSPDSCSLAPSRSSPAVMDWLRAVMEPPALLGVPPVPPALPMATTDSPTAALELEDRNVIGGVVTDDVGVVGLAIADVGHGDLGSPVDDVVVGEDLTVG